MAVETIRKWEYKGVMLEVKKISLISKEQWELAALVSGGDTADILKTGHHCGYATVSLTLGNGELEKHRYKDYGHPDIDVHGGVTFYQNNADGTATYGFDCAHAWDKFEDWDADKVSQECQSLANQLRKIAGIYD